MRWTHAPVDSRFQTVRLSTHSAVVTSPAYPVFTAIADLELRLSHCHQHSTHRHNAAAIGVQQPPIAAHQRLYCTPPSTDDESRFRFFAPSPLPPLPPFSTHPSCHHVMRLSLPRGTLGPHPPHRSPSPSPSWMPLPSLIMSSWKWIFYLGVLVAFIDGYGIGANDVANSFATSVGSGSLTLKQAVLIGMFTEASGAILLGKNTSETIRGKIIDVNKFQAYPRSPGAWPCCARPSVPHHSSCSPLDRVGLSPLPTRSSVPS